MPSPDPDRIFAEVRDVFQQSGRTENIPPAVQLVSKTGSVRHVAEQQIFTVDVADGKIHACRLFPKESCTCPSNTTCCHIIAAKESIGLSVTTRNVINLTQLRKNSR